VDASLARSTAVTSDEKGFLLALEKDPNDTTARAAFADWLDEHGRRYEAILQRARAGVSEVFYKLRRKSDGLYSDCNPHKPDGWSAKGKMWNELSSLRAHMGSYARSRRWRSKTRIPYIGNTDWDDLEVVVIELRFVEGVAMPVRYEDTTDGHRRRIAVAVVEPIGGAESES
jgi:uncharacterized protein (TIGR02996 family)